MAVIVFAVEGISWWTGRHWPHIFDKGRKTIAPSAAHADASGTVVFVRYIGWSIASALCAVPRVPFRLSPETVRSRYAVQFSVSPLLKQSRRRHFVFETAAALALARFQLIAVSRAFRTAIAFAPPTPLPTYAIMESQDCSSTEFFTSEIGAVMLFMAFHFKELVRNTDGMREELILATRKLALLEGNLVGRAEQKDEAAGLKKENKIEPK